jgi:hypothetical protein
MRASAQFNLIRTPRIVGARRRDAGGYARSPKLRQQSRYVISAPGSSPSCAEPSTDNSAVGCSNSEGGNTRTVDRSSRRPTAASRPVKASQAISPRVRTGRPGAAGAAWPTTPGWPTCGTAGPKGRCTRLTRRPSCWRHLRSYQHGSARSSCCGTGRTCPKPTWPPSSAARLAPSRARHHAGSPGSGRH